MEGRAPHTVLAVGEDPDFLERLSHLLGGKGFRPVCRQAANALRPEDGVIQAGILDVFCDDGPEGLELCQGLRRRCPDAPLILTSPFFNNRTWRQTAAAAGADCFFDKAWPLAILVSDVRYAVEGLKPTLTTGRVIWPETASVAREPAVVGYKIKSFWAEEGFANNGDVGSITRRYNSQSQGCKALTWHGDAHPRPL